ncbi:MAG: hypothetical protein K5657_00810 [Desulfovibrio sp.]|nr:hypothetical protein [Desulfovibrio sp.]
MRRLLFLLCLVLGAVQTLPAAETPAKDAWIRMPAGARPTYMGIHGGTMPVSLLVSDDGSSLLTFVGRTGNDFIETLHRTKFQLPSLLQKIAQNSTKDTLYDSPVLHAGNKNVSMPVLYITGVGFRKSTLSDAELLPFGFSQKPVSIEGSVSKPKTKSTTKNYRLFFEPTYLIPR